MAALEDARVEGLRGIMVQNGLATPVSRAFVAGTAAGLAAYAVKWPRNAFDEEGQMRPLSWVSKDPKATTSHFLVVPMGTAVLAYLFS
jgi:hypothetical protein